MPASDVLEIAPAMSGSMTEVLSLVFGNCQPQDALSRSGQPWRSTERAGCRAADCWPHAAAESSLVPPLPRCCRDEPQPFGRPSSFPASWRRPQTPLVSKAIAHAREAGVGVVHAVLEGHPRPADVARLEKAGFTPLAELYYLTAEAHDFPNSPPEGPLTFEPCTNENYRGCAIWWRATYEATLDCPGLDGLRTAAEVLEGYGADPGTCLPNWHLVRHQDRDVGCLLLTDYGEHGNCELTYMGLVPSVRGNGWGLHVTRYAQWLTRSLGRGRIVLAVDSANQPARDMYAAAGFRGWDRRQVYMLVLKS